MSIDLSRFEIAQHHIYDKAVLELKNGRKKTHWMWYIFPQIQGLGRSLASIKYAICDLKEAEWYLNHSVLGTRIIECCQILLQLENKTAEEIFGYVDAQKLSSSLTLFSLVPNASPIFQQVLQKYFDGKIDEKTKLILEQLSTGTTS